MENREVITTLNAIKFLLDNDQYTDDVESALDTAIAALEKQIPKRKLGKDPDNENLFTLRCPTCGELICNYNERLDRFSYMMKKNYCYICGQAIDFSKPQQEEQDG